MLSKRWYNKENR